MCFSVCVVKSFLPVGVVLVIVPALRDPPAETRLTVYSRSLRNSYN